MCVERLRLYLCNLTEFSLDNIHRYHNYPNYSKYLKDMKWFSAM